MGRGARLVARSSPAWPGAGAHRRRPRPRRRARRARRRRRSCPSRRRRRACRPRAARAAARRSPCPRRSARRAAAPQTARRPAGVACARTAGVMPNMLARLCRAGPLDSIRPGFDQRAQRCEGEGAPSAAQPAPAARRGARRDRLAISLLSSCCRYSRVFRFSTSAGAGGCSRKSGANASWYSFPGSSSPSSWPARAARCRGQHCPVSPGCGSQRAARQHPFDVTGAGRAAAHVLRSGRAPPHERARRGGQRRPSRRQRAAAGGSA